MSDPTAQQTRQTQVDAKGQHYIDLTPTWTAILPIWRMIVNDACVIKKPDQLQRFWTEMQNMAAAADKWNEVCAQHDLEADADEQQRINEGLAPNDGGN